MMKINKNECNFKKLKFEFRPILLLVCCVVLDKFPIKKYRNYNSSYLRTIVKNA